MDWLDLLAVQETLQSLLQHGGTEAGPVRKAWLLWVVGGLESISSPLGPTFHRQAPPSRSKVPGAHSPVTVISPTLWYLLPGPGFFGSSPETGEDILYFRCYFCFQFQNQLIPNKFSIGLLQVENHENTASASSPSSQSPG